MSTKASRKLAKKKKLTTWRPQVGELQLFDVPDSQRDHVRQRLYDTNALANVVVKKADCWNIAQTVVLNAQDDNIKYVEGAWEHLHTDKKRYASAKPHGWVTVDGYVVDLPQEFLTREDSTLMVEREAEHEFSYVEVNQLREEEFGDSDDWQVFTPYLWEQNGGVVPERLNQEHDDIETQVAVWEERNSYVYNTAFDPAITRLITRLETENKTSVRQAVPDGMHKVFYCPDHKENDPICKLHTAFDEAGFHVTSCSCCDEVGYAAHEADCSDASYTRAIDMFKQVEENIKGIPELHADLKGVRDSIKHTLREKSWPLYSPKAFTFETRIEPTNQVAQDTLEHTHA